MILVVLALAVAMVFSLQRQTGVSIENNTIESGLIESGSRPTLYFSLKNTGKVDVNCTNIIT